MANNEGSTDGSQDPQRGGEVPAGDGGAGGVSQSPTGPESVGPASQAGEDTGTQAAGAAGSSGGSMLSNFGGQALGIGLGMASLIARGGKNAGQAAMRMFSGAGARLMSAGTGISAATGGFLSPVAGAVATGGGVGVGALTAGTMVVTAIQPPIGSRDDLVAQCYEDGMQNAAAGSNSGPGSGNGPDADAETLKNAQDIYSILSYVGMGDENIAGILGNFDAESKIDPTSAQSVLTEPFEVGPATEAAASIPSTGIGLGQWTGDRNTALQEWTESKNGDWYDLELQMAFMLGHDGANSDIIGDMIDGTTEGSDDPHKAAIFFHKKWERSDDNAAQEARRGEFAEKWYVEMSGWTVDRELGASVLDMAETAKKSANNQAVQNELADCLEKAGGSAGGNEDAATAMATYAWAYLDWGRGNNGTELYQYLMGEIFPGDPYFKSCDRGVATAVRWSGTDDTFPVGPTSAQYQYFVGEGGDKWEEQPESDLRNEDAFKPGDVQVTKGDGHIQMYLGEEVVEDVWGSTDHEDNAVMASASYMERSPGLQNWEGYSTDSRPYSNWRSTGGEQDSKYTDIKIPGGMKDGPSSTK